MYGVAYQNQFLKMKISKEYEYFQQIQRKIRKKNKVGRRSDETERQEKWHLELAAW
jgi:hypothetical protein